MAKKMDKGGEPSVLASFLMCTDTFDAKFKAAVTSCLEQNILEIELVIVVNGVSEAEKEKIRKFCHDDRIILIFSSIRYLSANLNIGLQHCKSEYVARMDSDDISHPDRIEQQVHFLNENKNVVVCGSGYRLIDDKNKFIKEIIPSKLHKNILWKLYFNNPIAHPTVMFRKNVIESLGGYMGGKYAQDYDLWVRVALDTNYEFHNIDKCLLDYRSTGSGARRSKEAYANVAMVQWRQFILTLNPIWFLASLFSILKLFLR